MPAYEFLTLTGTIVPDTSDLLAEVQAEFRAGLGADLSVDPETPQGVLITGEVQSRAAAAANNAALANQINPELAGGRFLDALCALLGLPRDPETRTLVRDVNVFGQPGAVIPAGSRARTAGGALFAATGTTILSVAGAGTTDFLAVDGGPIPCGPGDLLQIVDAILGWETVFNPTAGLIGTDVQSDESLRLLRRLTLARQGLATPEAIISALYDTPDVRSLQFRENIGAAPATIDGILIGAHSIWVCVDGGTDEAVALALLSNKTAGAGYTGAVTVNVVDASSGQTYPVDFDRPTVVDMLVRVTARRGTYVGDLYALIQNAVLDYAEGRIPGEQGFVVGGSVSPFEIAGAIGVRAAGVFVVKVEVAPVSTGIYQTDEYPIALDEVPTVAAGSITLVEV